MSETTEEIILQHLRLIVGQGKATTYDHLAKLIGTAAVRIGRILKQTKNEELRRLAPFVLAHIHHYYFLKTLGSEYDNQLTALTSNGIPVVSLEAIGNRKIENLIRKQIGDGFQADKILVPESFIWLPDDLSKSA